MRKVVYTCEQCAEQRTPSNHWFMYREIAGGGIAFYPWPEVDDEKDKHLCSSVCAAKALHKHLEAAQ